MLAAPSRRNRQNPSCALTTDLSARLVTMEPMRRLARPFPAAAWIVALTDSTLGLPWKHLAFNSLMGMFLALVAGALWQRRKAPADWRDDKPMARFHPLTRGRLPMPAVEGCLRGMRLVQAGQVGLGAEVMLAAYRQAPNVQMIYNLAIAWHLAGSPLAETAYRTAIQLDPAHRDARFNLAKLLTDTGRPYEGLLAYRELVRALPKDGAAWFNLGTLCARLGMGPEAVAALRRARKLLGDDVACRHNLRLAKRLRPWWRLGTRGGAKPLLPSSGGAGGWV